MPDMPRPKKQKPHPYVTMRPQPDGSVRPRFKTDDSARKLGFEDRDLKHQDGRWFTYQEGCAFGQAQQTLIRQARATGQNVTTNEIAETPKAEQSVAELWDAYTKSATFLGSAAVEGLRPASRRSYKGFIKPLHAEIIWQAPVLSLSLEFFGNEETGLYVRLIGRHGLPMANGCLAALSAAIRWGLNNGWGKRADNTPMPHPLQGMRWHKPPPRLRIATDTEISALIAAADYLTVGERTMSAVGDAVVLAFFTGQRRGDVLSLVEAGTIGDRMRLQQSKTNARVSIPFTPRLAERIRQARARRADLKLDSVHIVINENTGRAYAGETFARHFGDVRAAAVDGIIDYAATHRAQAEGRNAPAWIVAPCPSLEDFDFADLRDTAVTWYARAECTLPEIASITGHSLKSIYSILKHYLSLDEHLADNAVRKLVGYMESQGLAV